MEYENQKDAPQNDKVVRWLPIMIIGTYLAIALLVSAYVLYTNYGLIALIATAKFIAVVILFSCATYKLRLWS